MSTVADVLIHDRDIRPLTATEFSQFRKLAYEKFGLDLRPGKEQLVSARLSKKMRELNLHSYQDYYQYVLGDKTGEALTAMIDALTTNHTSFFRESAHFDFLRQTILPNQRNRDRISIWSAACSTGEEPYSIAFSVLEELGWDALSRLQIVATDISTRVLQTAQKGAYPAERFRGIDPRQLRPYLLRGEDKWADWFLVKKEVRSAIAFRRLNLMEPFPHSTAFPVIFCRNVMIYFDRPTQEDLVNRLANCLEPGGYLLIGHAESLNGIEHPLEYVRPAIYKKSAAGQVTSQRGPGKK
jgi:chemotaxis protein methyltransferase CheR